MVGSLHVSQRSRILIMGNGGSGKTWLARALAARLGRPAVHLDDIHWEPGRCGQARDRQQAIADVEAAAQSDAWLIEGVYGRYLEIALRRATLLVWLDLPEETCVANIRRRGPQYGEGETALEDLLAWVAGYRLRKNNWNSFDSHLAMFERFEALKFRLYDRDAVSAWLAGVFGTREERR